MKRSAIALALAYLGYIWRSKSIYSIHSPFLFGLISKIKKDRREVNFQDIEQERKLLFNDHSTLEGQDFGTGKTQKKRVSEIAKKALKRKKEALLLYSIAQHLRSKNILELGTSLGISTAYMAKSKARVLSLEGNASVLNRARQVFEKMKFENIETLEGDINQTLSQALEKMKNPDFVFFDANHRKQPTLDYFKKVTNVCHNDTVLIFDDIHWSVEMEEAWQEIKTFKEVRLSIDLFHFGLIFFKKELSKQDFTIRL